MFDFSVLDKVVSEAQNYDIRHIAEETAKEVAEVETVAEFASTDILLDIRAPDEADDKPLELENVQVNTLPFYKLSAQFADLDQTKTYLLYCERGVMSRLQALYLIEQGFTNVKVYRP